MGNRPPNQVSKFSLLGWLLGALSLLNLIEDLTPIVLLGKMEKWIEAYSLIVSKIKEFIFGWIDFSWVSISAIEMHVIVIAAIFLTAFSRSIYISLIAHGVSRGPAIREMLGATTFHWLLILLPPLILPGVSGFIGVVIALLLCVGTIHETEKEPGWPTLPTVFRESVGTLSIFAILIVLNYTLF